MSATTDVATLHVVPGVRLFGTGEVRGDRWDEGDVDAIVRNGKLLSEYLKPTVVIGHEEEQPLVEGMPPTWVDNTGQPAFGVIRNLRKEPGPFPVGDLCDVPDWLFWLIRNKAYRTVSAEVYPADSPPEGLPPELQDKIQGPVLRRVSLLGGEIPQWKTLRDMTDWIGDWRQKHGLEPLSFTEPWRPDTNLRLSRVKRLTDGRVLLFSEVTNVATKTKPAKKKFKKFSELSAKAKATLKRFADDEKDKEKDKDDEKFDDGMAAAPDAAASAPPAQVSRQDMIALLGELGVDTSKITDAVPDEVLADMVRAIQGAQAAAAPPPAAMADPEPAPMAVTQPMDAAAAPSAAVAVGDPPAQEQLPTQVTTIMKYADPKTGKIMEKPVDLAKLVVDTVKAEFGKFSEKLDATTKQANQLDANTRRANIKAFCEGEVKAGRLLPAQREAVESRLFRCNHVQKFAEGENAGKSELDLQMEEISSGPVLVNFHERMQNRRPGSESATEEEAKVRRWAEANEDVLAKAGLTPAGQIKKFAEKLKSNPKYTAAEFGVAE